MSNDSSRVVFAMLVMDDQKGRLKRVPSRGEGGGGAWATPSALPPEPFCGPYGVLQVAGFLAVSGIKWPNQPKIVRVRDGSGRGRGNECKAACKQSCSCTAYAFHGSECLVWKGDLYSIRTDIAGDRKLHVKLASSALSDTEGKSKTLEVVIAVVVPVLVIVSGGFLGSFLQ
ncbi:hypothetical protein SASPL_143344 [Salvia splendens]|uniref:Apple domain-containing protein n=1 Tax=Salvia splendens TaxID=180675 RepID=A0A8X8WNG2_SALSN|nr:hypothetical protein SASPL_143344 [Salvia splendens]